MSDGLFLQVSLGGDAKDCLLAARVATTSGAELPVRVLQGGDEGAWTVALAALSVTQVVTLSAVAADEAVLEELTQKVNPLAARLPSPARMLRRQKAAPVALGARDALGEWDVRVDRLVSTRDGADVCHGHAVLTAAGSQALEGGLCVRALDAHGTDVADGAWTCLSDAVEELPGHPGFFARRVEFSLRVPVSVTTLVVWVCPDAATELPVGFACLGPRVTARIRELWRATTTSASDDPAYDDWYTSKHAATQAELSMQQDGSFERGVSFSVVAVLRNASPADVHEMADTVLEQSYGHLELVLVNAAAGDQRLAQAVRGIELADARVRSVPLGADFGSAAALSEGLDAATGDFVCLLDEGDLLAPDALWHLAAQIEANPRADVLYTDEDQLVGGRHVAPRFKPGWDPDLLLGTDYMGSLLCVRTALLHDMEPMGRALDGAERYRVALYATARARAVCHVPRVLCHVRNAVASDAGLAWGAGLAALRAHVAEQGLPADVQASLRVPRAFELAHRLPLDGDGQPPLVSVIVVNRDGVATLDRCLSSLRDHTDYPCYEVVVVEHESADEATFAYYRQAEEADERVRTIFYQGPDAANHARLVNFGVSRARGAYLVLLAPDTELVDSAWMGRLVALCAREGTAAAGARLLRPDGTVAFAGGYLSTHGPVALDRYRLADDCGQPGQALCHRVTLASGWCLALDAAALQAVGGVSEAFPGRYGDADLCLRLACAGYGVVLDPQVTVVTHRPYADDENVRRTSDDLRAMGSLWDSWPYGPTATDATMGPNVSHLSAYRILRS